MNRELSDVNKVRLDIQNLIDRTLDELREAFHRRARFSTRNEALEEISKLLFAHVISIIEGNQGISLTNIDISKNAAKNLLSFVNSKLDEHILNSSIQFSLHLDLEEDAFAKEIVLTFHEHCNIEQYASLLQGTDIINSIFGKFLANTFVDEKQLGQYLTPQEVVSFIVKIVLSNRNSADKIIRGSGKVMDPSCGVGSFLAEYSDNLFDLIKNRRDCSEIMESFLTKRLIGIDKSDRMIRFATINLSMFGYSLSNIIRADSLIGSSDNLYLDDLNETVDLILTNPPFGIEIDKKEIKDSVLANSITTKTINSEIFYFERYMQWLKPGGELVCIVPDSVLTNKGNYEILRNYLKEKVDLRAVISLPSNTFSSAGTDTKTSIIYLKKRYDDEPSNNLTYMSVCHSLGFDIVTKGSQKIKKHNDKSDLDIILDDFIFSKSQKGVWVKNIHTSSRWDAGFHASLPQEIAQKILDPSNNFLKISDVATLSKDKANPQKWNEEFFDYIEISNIVDPFFNISSKSIPCSEAPSRARKIVHTNDVIFSTVRPERGVVAVIDDKHDGFICSTGFAILVPHKIDPLTLALLLKSDFVLKQICRFSAGVSYPSIYEDDLLSVTLPIRKNECFALEQTTKNIKRLTEKLTIEKNIIQRSLDNILYNNIRGA